MKKKISQDLETSDEALVNLWSKSVATDVEFEIISRPPLVPLRDMQVGDVLDFTLLDVVASSKEGVTTPILVGALTADGSRVGVPAQATIVNQVLPGWNRLKDSLERARELCPYLGRRLLLKKVGQRHSKTWNKGFSLYEIAAQKNGEKKSK